MEQDALAELGPYLSGQALYGDDFTPAQIEAWFAEEAEGYAGLGAGDEKSYRYAYHALNRVLGYSKIGDTPIRRALGVGAAYGLEFEPIASRLEHLTILDPSESFSRVKEVVGVPCEYVQPTASGEMPFESGSFDLITCLGALHHIPNVSYVVQECSRCLATDGVMLLREPIVSMGDWRRPRKGLTKNERGIPLAVFRDIIEQAGLRARSESLCIFPPLAKIAARFGVSVYDSGFWTRVDILLSRLFAPNLRYHATKRLHRLRPASIYFVLEHARE